MKATLVAADGRAGSSVVMLANRIGEAIRRQTPYNVETVAAATSNLDSIEP